MGLNRLRYLAQIGERTTLPVLSPRFISPDSLSLHHLLYHRWCCYKDQSQKQARKFKDGRSVVPDACAIGEKKRQRYMATVIAL